ncbi:glycoside hydrolase family 13 protein [Bacillus testis]|uniref:glycoside hydrolase family 13 protein n=1 Tax=Bacillus testis TaxID=1622072 RepID=UPI00067E88C4|nr:alpha-glucosidase [Bacillus testis]
MEKTWWKEAVVYQIYPRSFKDSNGDGIGDLKGILSKLDYIKKLGVDVIWLSPVYASPNDDNGYDISDYYSIMEEFGTMAEMEELIRRAHEIGLKIVMDLVVNHTSDEHQWFKESSSNENSDKRDYYIWKEAVDGREPTNWESIFKGSAWEWNEATGDYYLHLFSKKQPDLNWENPELRQDIYRMMRWWLNKGIDGFRMDVINMISKDNAYPDGPCPEGQRYGDGSAFFMNGPKIHEYLQEMNREVLSKYDIMTVGETPGVTPEDAVLYTGGKRHELNMVFQFEHMGLGDGPDGKWNNGPWELKELKRILAKWQTGLHHDGWNSLYWDNHDQPRAVSRFGHDGKYRKESAKMLAACLHMMQGTPYIYQGEELGMTNVAFDALDQYKDIETLNAYRDLVEGKGWTHEKMMSAIHARGRDNARTPIQWDDSPNAGFTNGTPWIEVNPNYQEINVKQALEDKNSVFYAYQKLIQLRKQHDIIVYGDFQLVAEDDEQVFAYKRCLGDETLLAICHFSDEQSEFVFPGELEGRKGELLFSNYESALCDGSAAVLRPFECLVYLYRS